jgi:hypothetical protein
VGGAVRAIVSSTALGQEVPMETIGARIPQHDRKELQAWYVGRLRPKLERAAGAGSVEPAAVAALDVLLRDLLDLPATRRTEAA